MEMREVNKDLKLHFSKLQQRIEEFESRDREQGYFTTDRQRNKRNQRRYDSSEEEEAERKHSCERQTVTNIATKCTSVASHKQGSGRDRSNDKENRRRTNRISEEMGGMQCI